jgi:signal transduction histidine kinase
MEGTRTRRLPLQRALEDLDAWQAKPTATATRRVQAALGRLIVAYGCGGGYVELNAPPLPPLIMAIGSRSAMDPDEARRDTVEYSLHGNGGALILGHVWLTAAEGDPNRAAHALELAFDAAWSRAEARAAGLRLGALDAAVRGIAGIQSVERVLQLIVDRVRELSEAQYAALGILGQDGYLERFLTSGIGEEEKARIGALPRGRGLLGLIIREDRSFRIDDMAADPRRTGFPPHHPEMRSFLGVPVRSKGVSVGNLYLTNKQGARAFSEADQRLVEMFALHAGIALENARLHEEVGRLAVVEDRHRISQDLHDGIIQSLYAVALSLDDVPEILAEDETEGTARVDRAIDSIHQAIRDIRNFILGLEPELLDGADLGDGLRALSAEFHLGSVADLELHIDEPIPTLPPGAAAHLLAIAREALSNVARHSGATRVRLHLGHHDGTLNLIIGDNGRGFDPSAARSEEHHGLINLRARADSLGGTLAVLSESGAGTSIEVSMPLAHPDRSEGSR